MRPHLGIVPAGVILLAGCAGSAASDVALRRRHDRLAGIHRSGFKLDFVGQRIAWVPGGIPTNGRSYFGHLPAADHYRVTVWPDNVIERGDRIP
jgi:hypothetical protein